MRIFRLLLLLFLFSVAWAQTDCTLASNVSFTQDVATSACLSGASNASLCGLEALVDSTEIMVGDLNTTIQSVQAQLNLIPVEQTAIANQQVLNGSTSWVPCNGTICGFPGALAAVAANVTVLQGQIGPLQASLSANSADITTETNARIAADAVLQTEINALPGAFNGTTSWLPCNVSVCGLGTELDNSVATIADQLNFLGCPAFNVQTPKVVCYPDADVDGYGARSASPTYACEICPVGYVENNRDCDDSNALIFPGSTTCQSNPGSRLKAITGPRTSLPSGVCTNTAWVAWGFGLSLHAHTLVATAPCRNAALAWNWDASTDDWVPEGTYIVPGSVNATLFGLTVSFWEPYALFSQQALTSDQVNGFALWKRPAVGSAWTEISLNTTVVTQTNTGGSLGLRGGVNAQVANNLTVAGCAYSGNASRAALGLILNDIYSEWDLCSCAVRCPVGWSTVLSGAPTLCTALGLGTRALAIDRLDGQYAVVGDASDNLYFFQWQSSQWNYLLTKTDAGSGGLSASWSMYGATFAMGVPFADPATPAVPTTGSCAAGGGNQGYAVVYTKQLSTWIRYAQDVAFPKACKGDDCGSSVAVSTGSQLTAGCYGNLTAQGYVFTKPTNNLQYPTTQQRYSPSSLNAEATAGFGTSVDATGEFFVFSAPFKTGSGLAVAGQIYVSECTNVLTCVD